MIVEVAINVPIRKCFDYCWPEDIELLPEPGLQVLVPFGRQKKGGVIVGVNNINQLKENLNIRSTKEKKDVINKILKLKLNNDKFLSPYKWKI